MSSGCSDTDACPTARPIRRDRDRRREDAMPLSLEVALWTIMIGAIAVASWPANLIGSFEQRATRRWARSGGPTGLERRMARAPLAVAAVLLTVQTLVLWPFIGPRSLLTAVFFSWLSYAQSRAYRNLLQQPPNTQASR
jgi:hypothetical protein